MVNLTGSNKKPHSNLPYKNPLETLREMGTNSAKKTADAFDKIGDGALDQIFDSPEDDEFAPNFPGKQEKNTPKKQEAKVFNYNEYYEQTLVKKQIKELTEQIRREIEALKKADHSLVQQVKDIEKLTINDLPEKPGIYHVRFLEVVLSILKVLRAKVGESKTWLTAMMSRRKKRGSLFAARSKKSGTQYSMSQELQSARSVQ